ncbi:MAG: DUF4346 domain-containing protein [Gammaproteobacteria bacterium]
MAKLLNGITAFVRRTFVPKPDQWPFIRGDYDVIDAAAPVVVVLSNDRASGNEFIAKPPPGLCMLARLHSAGDAAKLLRAVAANLSIQTLICAAENPGQQPLAAALLKLGRGDEVPGGPLGSLMNTIASQLERAELDALRERVDFVDMLACSDTAKIGAKVATARSAVHQANAGFVTRATAGGAERLIVPRDLPNDTLPDKTGRFRIRLEEHSIVVDHIDTKERLVRVIEGKTARDICLTLIRNGWVSRLDHAAYLGRDLARAELALRNGQPFTPDSTEPLRDDARTAPER